MKEYFGELIDQHNIFDRYQNFEELRASMLALADNHPRYVRVEEIGRATDRTKEYPEGRPIEVLLASTPSKEAARPWALLQMEHENELPPTLALLLIAKVVAKHPEILDELGYNLAIIPLAHPDGIAMQYWVQEKRNFEPLEYLLGFFRSAASEQIAWGFPFKYENTGFDSPTAETLAIMGLMKRLRPRVLHSLHANPAHDVYFFGSNSSPALLADTTVLVEARGLHMQYSAPELPFMTLHDSAYPGFFRPYTVRETIHMLAGNGGIERLKWQDGGTNSYDYLRGIVDHPEFFLSEFPYMTAAALRDQTLSGTTQEEARREMEVFTASLLEVVRYRLDQLRPAIKASHSFEIGRFERSLAWWIELTEKKLVAAEGASSSPEASKLLTNSEYFGISIWRFLRMSFAGQVHSLARLLGDEETAATMRKEIETRLGAFTAEYPLQSYPLRTIVGAQALSSLVALDHKS